MKSLRVVPVGPAPIEILDRLAARLAFSFGVSCHVDQEPFDPDFAWEPSRGQYYATSILDRLSSLAEDKGQHVLGVTPYDLFVPVLTYVFGEAQMGGPAALVSLRRLGEEFYGIPPNEALRDERLEKEALHELGHTLGLGHCRDWRCVMVSTHAVERLDLKESAFCPQCRGLLRGIPINLFKTFL